MHFTEIFLYSHKVEKFTGVLSIPFLVDEIQKNYNGVQQSE